MRKLIVGVALVMSSSAAARSDYAREPTPEPRASRTITSIVVERPDDASVVFDRATFDVREVGDHAIVTLSITLSSAWRYTWRVGRMMVSLPRDAKVVGLAFDIGDGAQLATSMPAAEAQESFRKLTETSIDPALFEWTRSTRDYERFRLSVFPVAHDKPATTTLTIVMPRFAQLLGDIAGKRLEVRGGMPVDATDADRAILASETVRKGHSLYVAPVAGLTAREISNFVRSSELQLQSCTLVSDGEVDAEVLVVFTVGADGKVARPSIKTADHGLAQCLSNAIANWQFPASDSDHLVQYPLRLRP